MVKKTNKAEKNTAAKSDADTSLQKEGHALKEKASKTQKSERSSARTSKKTKSSDEKESAEKKGSQGKQSLVVSEDAPSMFEDWSDEERVKWLRLVITAVIAAAVLMVWNMVWWVLALAIAAQMLLFAFTGSSVEVVKTYLTSITEFWNALIGYVLFLKKSLPEPLEGLDEWLKEKVIGSRKENKQP